MLQFGLAEPIGVEAKARRRLAKIRSQNPAQVRMGHSITGAIRRKMKTLHPVPFLLVEYFDVSRQIHRGGLERPGPHMDFIGSKRPAHSASGPRQPDKASGDITAGCYELPSALSREALFSEFSIHINSNWRSLFVRKATSRALTSSDSARAISCCKKLNAGRISTGKSSLRSPRRTSH